VLDVADVHTYYGESHVLQGISLRVEPGEVLAILGRNGMGKTTLIRTLMGLVPARHGAVLIDGREAHGMPAFRIARAGIAYVPEGRGIFAGLSVAENLAIAERTARPPGGRHAGDTAAGGSARW